MILRPGALLRKAGSVILKAGALLRKGRSLILKVAILLRKVWSMIQALVYPDLTGSHRTSCGVMDACKSSGRGYRRANCRDARHHLNILGKLLLKGGFDTSPPEGTPGLPCGHACPECKRTDVVVSVQPNGQVWRAAPGYGVNHRLL
jgi:hypothetical protein